MVGDILKVIADLEDWKVIGGFWLAKKLTNISYNERSCSWQQNLGFNLIMKTVTLISLFDARQWVSSISSANCQIIISVDYLEVLLSLRRTCGLLLASFAWEISRVRTVYQRHYLSICFQKHPQITHCKLCINVKRLSTRIFEWTSRNNERI